MTTSVDSKPSPTPVRTSINLAVTFLGKFWQLGLALACMPVYLKALGPEGFGVIGLYLAIQRIATLFDSGFSRAINRELACCRSGDRPGDTLRTLEVAYGSMCLVAFLLAAVGATLSVKIIPLPDTYIGSPLCLLLLMITAVVVQLPSSFYCAALTGLERHIELSSIQAVWQGLRFLGAAVVVSYYPTLTAFFIWQIAVGVIFTLNAWSYAWRAIPTGILKPHIRPDLLSSVGVYATGVTLCAGTAVAMTQLDKLLLYYQLSPSEYGYYMVAWSLAATLFVVASPIPTVIFPRFSRLASLQDGDAIKSIYHTTSQAVAVAVAPAAITASFFSRELLFAWLGDANVANRCDGVLSLLALGIGLNCLSITPHVLQLASGWVSLSNWMNIASLLILGPLIYGCCFMWGSLGAGFAWITFAAIYLSVQVGWMHSRLLPTELAHWLRDQLVIVGLSTAVATTVYAFSAPKGRLEALFYVFICWLLALSSSCLAAPCLRKRLVRYCAARGLSLATSPRP